MHYLWHKHSYNIVTLKRKWRISLELAPYQLQKRHREQAVQRQMRHRSVNSKLYYNNAQVSSSEALKGFELRKKAVRCPCTKSSASPWKSTVLREKARSWSPFFSACCLTSLNVLMNGRRYIRLAPLRVTSEGTYGIILAWLNWSDGVDGVKVEVSHTDVCIKTGNFF